MIFSDEHKVTMGLSPVADAFAGTVYSDVVSIKNVRHVTFIVLIGVGTTGTTTFTVQACDDFTPSNSDAVAFKYRKCTTMDTFSTAVQSATTAGFLSTAGSDQLYIIEVDADAVLAAGQAATTPYDAVGCRLKCVEGTDAAMVGAILVIGSEQRVSGQATATFIA